MSHVAAVAPEDKPIDVRTFWQAVGLRAVGTAIVTAEAEDGPRGFLALSATHVCSEPPILSISVDKKTSALATILEAGHFAINYLATTQAEVAAPFGGKGDLKGADRFTTAQWNKGSTGAPVLAGASGVLECVVEESIERYGTVIVFGRLVGFSSTPDTLPLVSYKGKYLNAPA